MRLVPRKRKKKDPYRSGFFAWSDPFAHARFDQGDLSAAQERPAPPVELRGSLRQTQSLMDDQVETLGSETAFKSFWDGEGEQQTVEERFKKILK